MKLIHKTEPIPDNYYIRYYFTENHAFFDIETTGFSPKTSFVYLIGLALRRGEEIHIYQFFAENRREEEEILKGFYQRLCMSETIITFNGPGFDIPFLKSREALYHLDGGWESFQYIDLYKITSRLSHLLKLPDKKQKSAEQFLGIQREDLYTGGDLISVYFAYEKQQDSQSETLLLLHNYEDVLGMTKLLALLSYADFFAAPANVLGAVIQNYRPYNASEDESELLITLKASVPFPKQILVQTDFCSLMCRDETAQFLVKICQGEFRFYYDNYRDYYYLPDEDMAIHKSVAAFVDSKHRKKATAATCYSRRKGTFLPQQETLFTPCFYPEKKSKTSYFELQDSFLTDSDSIALYASHLLKLCQ